MYKDTKEKQKRIEADLSFSERQGNGCKGKLSVRLSMLAGIRPFQGLFKPPALPEVLTFGPFHHQQFSLITSKKFMLPIIPFLCYLISRES